jgi:methyl-accepting chemotaxis protein
MNIQWKISGMCIALVLSTALSIVGITLYQKSVIENKLDTMISAQGRDETGKAAQSIYLMCKAVAESVSQTVASNLRVAEDVMAGVGPVSFAEETVVWQAVNQYTKQKTTQVLPKMLVGDKWLGQVSQGTAPSPLVDKVKELVGGTCTIFQRMNAEGDMLRVATNVEKLDGQRAIGTYIPRINPDGKPNPVISAVLRGETFYGRAYVVNAWYITAYKPIWDAAHEQVVGILYFGEKQENVASLRKGIVDTVVGKTGYAFVLGGKGAQKGRFIISRGGRVDGKQMYDVKDAEGRPFVRSMVDKAVAMEQQSGVIPIAFEEYSWKNEGESAPRQKIAAVTYFAPWDWVICASIYEDDLQGARDQVAGGLNGMIRWVVLLAALVVTIAATGGFLLARGISRPLQAAVSMIVDLERGQLDRRLNLQRKDEIGQIATTMDAFAENLQSEVLAAFEKLAEGDFTFEAKGLISAPLARANSSLCEIITRVQSAAQEIAGAASQVSDSSQDLSQGATESAASLEQISASMTELAAQTRGNAENAKQANQLSATTKTAAVEGRELMNGMVQAMSEIDQASGDISKINKVIDEIAFQTNLLALNAAVEAARAGQYGKGFAVVAEEVRNLAGRSARAARETAELIENAMNKTRNGSEIADQTSTSLEGIVSGATRATDLIGEIAAASDEQSTGIGQVHQGLGQIDQVTQRNTANAEESAAASEELSSQAEQLLQMLQQFKVGQQATVTSPSKALPAPDRSSLYLS